MDYLVIDYLPTLILTSVFSVQLTKVGLAEKENGSKHTIYLYQNTALSSVFIKSKLTNYPSCQIAPVSPILMLSC